MLVSQKNTVNFPNKYVRENPAFEFLSCCYSPFTQWELWVMTIMNKVYTADSGQVECLTMSRSCERCNRKTRVLSSGKLLVAMRECLQTNGF